MTPRLLLDYVSLLITVVLFKLRLALALGLHSTVEAFSLGVQISLLLSLRTVLRPNPSSAKQWISQMQLVVTSVAKYFKKSSV